jgi:hypothetical protein
MNVNTFVSMGGISTEMDVMATTPRRIADLICPEVSDSELKAIRRRVHDTVVLGLGTNASMNMGKLILHGEISLCEHYFLH